MNPETPLTGAEVITLLGLLADLAEQARENRLVQFGKVRRRGVIAQLQLLADQAELAVGVTPLAQAQVIEEVLPAPAAQRTGTQRQALLLEAAPHIDQCGEVGIHVLPLR